MPFVKVSRDKRGYELISLVHVFGGRRGKPSKPRVLYVFRTPPGVKVGREPFDESVRQALEAQNPGVVFDWQKLSVIPVPAPDIEYWRERRRAEKAAKLARREEEAEAEAEGDTEAEGEAAPGEPAVAEPAAHLSLHAAQETDDSEPEDAEEAEISDGLLPAESLLTEDVTVFPDEAQPVLAQAEPAGPSTVMETAATLPDGLAAEHRRRRRRGGRRRRRRPRPQADAASNLPNSAESAGQHQGTPDSPGTPKIPEDPSKEA